MTCEFLTEEDVRISPGITDASLSINFSYYLDNSTLIDR